MGKKHRKEKPLLKNLREWLGCNAMLLLDGWIVSAEPEIGNKATYKVSISEGWVNGSLPYSKSKATPASPLLLASFPQPHFSLCAKLRQTEREREREICVVLIVNVCMPICA